MAGRKFIRVHDTKIDTKCGLNIQNSRLYSTPSGQINTPKSPRVSIHRTGGPIPRQPTFQLQSPLTKLLLDLEHFLMNFQSLFRLFVFPLIPLTILPIFPFIHLAFSSGLSFGFLPFVFISSFVVFRTGFFALLSSVFGLLLVLMSYSGIE